MSKIDDKPNEVLDIANDVTVEEVKKTLPTVPEDKDPDIDFEPTVKIFTICLTNNETIDNILELSKDNRTSSCL